MKRVPTDPRTLHDIMLEVLRDTPSEDLPRVATAASEFFLDVLATSDLAQRAFREGA